MLYAHLNPFIYMGFLHTNEMTSTIIVDKVYKESKDNLEEDLNKCQICLPHCEEGLMSISWFPF